MVKPDAQSESLVGRAEQQKETPNWVEILRGSLGTFIGVTIPEEALARSLEHARFSLQPLRNEAEFHSLFPSMAEMERIALNVLKRSQPGASDVGDRLQPSRPLLSGMSYASSAIEVEAAITKEGSTGGSDDLLASILGQPNRPPAQPKEELDPDSAMILQRVMAEMKTLAFKEENARIEKHNQAFLDTVARLSQNGRYIVIHGGNTAFSNTIFQIFAQGGLNAMHRQELERQNFFLIPLERWVAFCREHFPEIMGTVETAASVGDIIIIDEKKV